MDFRKYLVFPENETSIVNMMTESPLRVNKEKGRLAGFSIFLQVSNLVSVQKFERSAFEKLNGVFFITKNNILWDGLRQANKRGVGFESLVLKLIYEIAAYDDKEWRPYTSKTSDLKLKKPEVRLLLYGVVKGIYPINTVMNELANALIQNEVKWFFSRADLLKINSEIKDNMINLISSRSLLGAIVSFIDQRNLPLPWMEKSVVLKAFFQLKLGELKKNKLNYETDKNIIELLSKDFFSVYIPLDKLSFFDDLKNEIVSNIAENISNIKKVAEKNLEKINPAALLSHILIYETLLTELPEMKWEDFFGEMIKYENALEKEVNETFVEKANSGITFFGSFWTTKLFSFLKGKGPILFIINSPGVINEHKLRDEFVTNFTEWKKNEENVDIDKELVSNFFESKKTQLIFLENTIITDQNIVKEKTDGFLAIFKADVNQLVLYLINWDKTGIKEFDVFYPDITTKKNSLNSIDTIESTFIGDVNKQPIHVFGNEVIKFAKGVKLTLQEQYHYALWYLDCRINFLGVKGVSNLKVFFSNLDKYIINVYYTKRFVNIPKDVANNKNSMP